MLTQYICTMYHNPGEADLNFQSEEEGVKACVYAFLIKIQLTAAPIPNLQQCSRVIVNGPLQGKIY